MGNIRRLVNRCHEQDKFLQENKSRKEGKDMEVIKQSSKQNSFVDVKVTQFFIFFILQAKQ